MMNNYKQSKRNLLEGYELDFGIILEKAFNNYKKIVGIAGVSLLLLTIIYFVLVFAIVGIAFGFSGFGRTLTDINLMNFSTVFLIGYVAFSAVVAGILANFNAGFYKMAYCAELDKPYDVGTLFDYFKTSYFKELFLSGLIIALITSPIALLFKYIGFELLGVLLTYVIYYLTFLAVPLIIFSDMKAVDAIIMSVKLVLKNPFILLGLLIVVFILSLLGLIGFCIGIFFTLPLLYSTIFCIYNEISPVEATNIIDEIGTHEE